MLYTYTPVPMEGQLFDGARRLGFSFPQTLEQWATPVWEQFSMRRGDGIPWVNPEGRRRVRNFERVVNAFYPTATDPHLTRIHRAALNGERVEVRCGVRRAVRTARAASPHSLSASGDDGVLMSSTVAADIREAYDLWAETYPAVAHNPLMRIEQEIVQSILRTLGPSRALDVGTGSGRYCRCWRALAPRASWAWISRWRCCGGRESARGLVCADARQLPFARFAFDLVNASLTVGDVADLPAWTREMARVLARGGHLVYSDFHPSWARRGWKRTFRSRDGETHELGFAAHAIDDHLAAIEARAFASSPSASRASRTTTRSRAWEFRRRWRNPPVVVVFRAAKRP